MRTQQNILIERLREILSDEPVQREVPMFGARSFMVNEKMIVSALKNGGLLVRIAADRHDELLQRPGARQAEMGAGRDMGPGWIEVSVESLHNDTQLQFWVDAAMEYNRTVTTPR